MHGNPNVGKSTIFNALTGLHQHTGNWPGKTVSNAAGMCHFRKENFLLIDIPGTYSLMSHSEEEEIARNYICFGNPDTTVVILDATCLERNLNLVYQIMEITPNIVVCVNLLDEAKKKGININLEALQNILGVPVIGTIARKPKTLEHLIKKVQEICHQKQKNTPKRIKYLPAIEESIQELYETISNKLPKEREYLARWVCLKIIDGDKKIIQEIERNFSIQIIQDKKIQKKLERVDTILSNAQIEKEKIQDNMISSIIFRTENVAEDVVNYHKKSSITAERKIDKMLTSKKWGIPIMLAFLGAIFWITITGANYPSQLLSQFFGWLQEKIVYAFELFGAPSWLKGVLIDGMYRTLTWVIAVMLPPMAIFFPLFTILEDIGYLPRLAFNLDKCFKKAGSSGKQALTMCMGFGCNAAGVVGARIIDSPREKLIAILTNAFVPCNGRFPFLITIAMIFFAGSFGAFSSIISTVIVLLVILLGIFMTLLVSKILSKTILKGVPTSFVLELPPYRKPQFGKVLVRSILDRTLFVLGRAISVAAPAGIVIWLLANITIGDINLLTMIANFLDPFAKLMGLDGYILTAFILGLPANEIVLPIILMSYMQTGTLVDLESTNIIGQILIQNGWTYLTAINVMILTLLHFPCSTTLLSIKKEAGGWKWTGLAFILPTICGMMLCMLITLLL